MGNTQVTPIKPATPPLISLAGKLGSKDVRHIQSVEDKEAVLFHLLHIRPYLICLSAIYEKPQPVGVSLKLWDCPSVTGDVCCSAGIWCALLWGDLQNENVIFLQQTPAYANLKIYISLSRGQQPAS